MATTSKSNSTSNRPPSSQDPSQSGIYILGTGSIGKFLAHALHSVPDPPPTALLFHRPSFLRDLPVAPRSSKREAEDAHFLRLGMRPSFKPRHCEIKITTSGQTETRGPFNAELVLPERRDVARGARQPLPRMEETEEKFADMICDTPIECLVVCVKAHQTVSALRSVKHRLTRDSTVLFLQNGMGTIEEVDEKVWPEEEEARRPHYMVGVNSHGVHATGPFSATHAGKGVIYLGLPPRTPSHLYLPSSSPEPEIKRETESATLPPTARHLLHSLTRVPLLAATPLSPTALHLAQLEKLAVNCVINPLTVLLDARNGDLLHNYSLTRVMRLLLAEISLVFANLPELRGVPSVKSRFAVERLEALAVSVAGKTAGNISSMLQDVRRGVRTEVDFLNGYVVRRAEEGLRRRRESGRDAAGEEDVRSARAFSPVMNYMVMNLVKGKQNMISREVDSYSPFETLGGPAGRPGGAGGGSGGPKI